MREAERPEHRAAAGACRGRPPVPVHGMHVPTCGPVTCALHLSGHSPPRHVMRPTTQAMFGTARFKVVLLRMVHLA